MKPSHRLLLLSCLLALWTLPQGFSTAAAAQEWTRFRGPDGSGQSDADTIPVTWTAKDYRWKVELPGTGYSSPVIWGERIFVSSTIEDDATRIICCLRTSDGGQIWKQSFQSTTYRMNPANSYASASPVVDQDRVYLTWTTPEHYYVVALDQANGREVWRRDLGPFAGQHGFGASPILWSDLLIVPNDQDKKSFVVALDRKTGDVRWQADRRSDRAAYSTPCILQGESGPPQVILTCSAHGVTSLDPATGKVNWELGVFKDRVVGSPMIASGLIIAGSGEGGGGKRVVAIRPADPAKGTRAELAYEFKGSLPYVPTPVAYGRLLFLWSDQGVVTCADAPTGKVLWQQRVGGKYFGSPVRVRDRIYCISREGEVVALAAAEKYRLLGRVSLEKPSHSTPAIAGGVMYLRTVSHLAAIGGN